MRPLLVKLPFQVGSAVLASDVTGDNEEGKTDPRQERVPGEETTVEENASPADQGHDARLCSDRRNDELLRVSDLDNVSPIPHARGRVRRQKMREAREIVNRKVDIQWWDGKTDEM